MGAKREIYDDIRILEEKLQTLKGGISDKEYEEIRKKIEEIKLLGVNLSDKYYITQIPEIMSRIVDLEFGKLSDKDMEESIKDKKRLSFLDRIEYIKLLGEKNQDVKGLIIQAREYWDSIKHLYDDGEALEVSEKLEELFLQYNITVEEKDDFKVFDEEKSAVRRKLIGEISKKYNIPIKDLSIDEESLEYAIYIKECKGFFGKKYRALTKDELFGEYKSVVAIIINNSLPDPFRTIHWAPIELYRCELDYLVLPDNLRELWFSNEVKVNNIGIPRKIRRIDDYSFMNSGLKRVIFSEGLKKIGKKAFFNCNLETVELPNTLEEIGVEAFGNNPLCNVVFNEGLKEIGEGAFSDCNLETVHLPSTISVVGNNAFGGNTVPKVIFPNGAYTKNNSFKENTDFKATLDNMGKEIDESINLEELLAEKKRLENKLLRIRGVLDIINSKESKMKEDIYNR